jgi:hypothetical protein
MAYSPEHMFMEALLFLHIEPLGDALAMCAEVRGKHSINKEVPLIECAPVWVYS